MYVALEVYLLVCFTLSLGGDGGEGAERHGGGQARRSKSRRLVKKRHVTVSARLQASRATYDLSCPVRPEGLDGGRTRLAGWGGGQRQTSLRLNKCNFFFLCTYVKSLCT